MLVVSETRYRIEGGRLKTARALLGFTQQTFADRIGSSLATVKSWERGNSLPNRDYGTKLAKLGVNMDYVISGGGEALIPSARRVHWNRLVDEASAPAVAEPTARYQVAAHTLTDLCAQLAFTPPAYWLLLVQELLVLEGLSERGARRLLETLKEDEARR